MEVYRISKCKYIQDLSGMGARVNGGRWNSKGQAVVYTASGRSLAALEALVHIPQKNLPSDFCIAILNIPDALQIKILSEQEMPNNWKTVAILPATPPIGDKWLQEVKTPLLKVPSVIIPEEYNLLINPAHPDAQKIRIKHIFPFVFDKRLRR